MRPATKTASLASLAAIMDRHGLTQRDVSSGADLALSIVNDLVNKRRNPTTATVNRLLAFLRKYEPRVAYEDLFE
jgi:hypothetical protein